MADLKEIGKRQNELCEQIDEHEGALLKLRAELYDVNREVKRLLAEDRREQTEALRLPLLDMVARAKEEGRVVALAIIATKLISISHELQLERLTEFIEREAASSGA